jgi:hypothetical protein
MNTQNNDQTTFREQQNGAPNADSANRLEYVSIPVGSFAGTLERIIRVRDGRPIPADTGDQGGGQN